jgi:hypothetical protein
VTTILVRILDVDKIGNQFVGVRGRWDGGVAPVRPDQAGGTREGGGQGTIDGVCAVYVSVSELGYTKIQLVASLEEKINVSKFNFRKAVNFGTK